MELLKLALLLLLHADPACMQPGPGSSPKFILTRVTPIVRTRVIVIGPLSPGTLPQHVRERLAWPLSRGTIFQRRALARLARERIIEETQQMLENGDFKVIPPSRRRPLETTFQRRAHARRARERIIDETQQMLENGDFKVIPPSRRRPLDDGSRDVEQEPPARRRRIEAVDEEGEEGLQGDGENDIGQNRQAAERLEKEIDEYNSCNCE